MDEGLFVKESLGGGTHGSFMKEGYSFVPEGRHVKTKGRGPHSSLPPPNSARSEQDCLREIAKWEEREQKKRKELEDKRRFNILEREKVRSLIMYRIYCASFIHIIYS